jgi:hypothetical protein
MGRQGDNGVRGAHVDAPIVHQRSHEHHRQKHLGIRDETRQDRSQQRRRRDERQVRHRPVHKAHNLEALGVSTPVNVGKKPKRPPEKKFAPNEGK